MSLSAYPVFYFSLLPLVSSLEFLLPDLLNLVTLKMFEYYLFTMHTLQFHS